MVQIGNKTSYRLAPPRRDHVRSVVETVPPADISVSSKKSPAWHETLKEAGGFEIKDNLKKRGGTKRRRRMSRIAVTNPPYTKTSANEKNERDNEMVRRFGIQDLYDRSTISGYERGDCEPPLPILLKYARLIGISTDVLIDDKLKLP